MRRRAIIRSKPLRRSLIVLGVVALAVALLGCTLRVARPWSIDDGQGRVDAHSVALMHGTLVWKTDQYSSRGFQPTTPILDWQIEPGLSWTMYRLDRIEFLADPPWSETKRSVAFSIPLALLGMACLILAIPWLPRQAGVCACGYSVTGLRSDRCPECGEPLAADCA